MEKWLKDLFIVTFGMVMGVFIGIYGGRFVYYGYIGSNDRTSMMVEGFSAVVLVNIVIYTYIVINHSEDFKAMFCGKRNEWIQRDREINDRLIREREQSQDKSKVE